MTACTFPACAAPPTTANRLGEPTCSVHAPVVVSGSFAKDRHYGTSRE